MPSARDLAQNIYEWARSNGVLAERTTVPTGEPRHLSDIGDGEPEKLEFAQHRLAKAQLVGVVANEEQNEIIILAKGVLGPRIAGRLPDQIDGVAVSYIGGATIHENPPEPIPASAMAHAPFHLHKSKIACGSSVTAAPIYGAGTLGCLVSNSEGTLCGLTNNHVTGDCNHTRIGMHILSPAPIDASPNGPAPTGIGRHYSLVALGSGDPQQVPVQELDAALFSIDQPSLVSSMQGPGWFDTPAVVIGPTAGTIVKKQAGPQA
jgi:hypothetical protein